MRTRHSVLEASLLYAFLFPRSATPRHATHPFTRACYTAGLPRPGSASPAAPAACVAVVVATSQAAMAGYRELRTELDEIGPQMQRAAWARPACP